MNLAEARAAIERGDEAHALTLLLEVWRETRDPAVADLIDRLSSRVARPYRAVFPDALRGIEHSMRWRQRSESGDPLDVPALLAALNMADSQLEYLSRWPDDPRLARWLVRTQNRYRGKECDTVRVMLSRLGDQRVVDELRAAGVWRETADAVAARTIVPAAPAELAAIVAIIDRRDTDDRAQAIATDELLARIYAHPDDLDERAVIADWLVERGDPRGELISLQLAPPTRERRLRAKQLVREHYRTWMGELYNAVYCGTYRFRRGVPDGARIDVRELHHALEAPQWSTLRYINLDHDGAIELESFVRVLSRCRSLEQLSGAGALTQEALAAGACPKLRWLAIPSKIRRAARAMYRELPALPRLEAIWIADRPPGWMLESPVWRRIQIVSTGGRHQLLGRWLEIVRRPESANISSFRFTPTYRSPYQLSAFSFRFTPPGRLYIVRGQQSRWFRSPDAAAELRLALASIPTGSLDAVRCSKLVDKTDELVAELARITR